MGIEVMSAAASVGVCIAVGILILTEIEALSAAAFDSSCVVGSILILTEVEVLSAAALICPFVTGASFPLTGASDEPCVKVRSVLGSSLLLALGSHGVGMVENLRVVL